MNTLISLIRNAGFSMLADLLNRAANTLIFIAVSRLLGVPAAGAYSLAFSYFLIGSRFSFWGLDHLLTRDVARDRSEAGRYFVNFLFLRALLGVVAIVLLSVLVWNLPYELSTRITIIFLAFSIFPENVNNICQALFMAYERMGYLSLVAFFGGVAKLICGFAVLYIGRDVEIVALAFTAASMLTMVCSLYLALTRFVRPAWQIDWGFCRQQLRVAVPFIFIGVFFILDNRMDVIVLSLLSDERSVGFYSAAATIVTALAMLPQGIRNAIYPILARYQATSRAATTRLYSRAFKYLFLLAVPMTVGIILVADQAIYLVYSNAFLPSIPVLQVMILSLLFYSLTILNSRLLIVSDRQDLLARFLLVSLITSLILNVLLVPTLDAVGAAIARVASTAVLFFLGERAVRQYLDETMIWRSTVRPLAAGALMATVLIVLGPSSLWIEISLGGLVYVGALFILGTFPPDERLLWHKIITRPLNMERADG